MSLLPILYWDNWKEFTQNKTHRAELHHPLNCYICFYTVTDNKMKTLNTEIKTFSFSLADLHSVIKLFKHTCTIQIDSFDSLTWLIHVKKNWLSMGRNWKWVLVTSLHCSVSVTIIITMHFPLIECFQYPSVQGSCLCYHWLSYLWKLLAFLMEKFEHWLTNLDKLYKPRCYSHQGLFLTYLKIFNCFINRMYHNSIILCKISQLPVNVFIIFSVSV